MDGPDARGAATPDATRRPPPPWEHGSRGPAAGRSAGTGPKLTTRSPHIRVAQCRVQMTFLALK